MPRTFVLSTEQRSMLFLDRLLGPGILHNLTAECPVPPGTPYPVVAAALERLAELHPALRAVLVGDDRRSQALAGRPIEVRRTRLAADADPEGHETRFHHLRLDRAAGARAYAEAAYGQDGTGRLLLALDHLVCDAAARTVLLRDLAALLAPGGPGTAPSSAPSDFESYCEEQHRALTEGGALRRESERWKQTLDGVGPLTGLTERGPGTPRLEARCWQRTWAGGGLHRAVAELALCTGTTAFVAVAALYAVAVWRRTGVAASAFITPVSNRRTARHLDLVATLVNERPVPYRVDPDASFAELAHGIGAGLLAAMRSSQAAIPDLVERVDSFHDLFLSPGCEYLQLQVEWGADPGGPAAADGEPVERSWAWGGPYAPATDITCTVVRAVATAESARVNTFHAGPSGAGQRVADLAGDFAELARRAADHPGLPVGRLAEPTP